MLCPDPPQAGTRRGRQRDPLSGRTGVPTLPELTRVFQRGSRALNGPRLGRQGQTHPSNPPASSNAWPRFSMVCSWKWLVKICMPMGSPSRVLPQGTLIPAMPAKLPVIV